MISDPNNFRYTQIMLETWIKHERGEELNEDDVDTITSVLIDMTDKV